jgi:hypothetical protein
MHAMTQSFDDIEARLRAIWNARPSPDEPPPRARERHICALMEIASFFQNNGVDASVVHEIRTIAISLRDLNTGAVAPFLQVKRLGKPQLPTDVWMSRAMVAIAVDYLSRFYSEREAAQLVASTSKHWGALFGVPDFEERARKWPGELRSGVIKNSTAIKAFNKREEVVEAERAELERAGRDPEPMAIARAILRYAAIERTKASGNISLRAIEDLGF